MILKVKYARASDIDTDTFSNFYNDIQDKHFVYNHQLIDFQSLYIAYIHTKKDIDIYFKKTKRTRMKTEAVILAYVSCRKELTNNIVINLTETHELYRCLGLNTSLLKFIIHDNNLTKKNKIMYPDFPVPPSETFWIKYLSRIYNVNNSDELCSFQLKHNFNDARLCYLYKYYDKSTEEYTEVSSFKT
jgi:hypothetical protein